MNTGTDKFIRGARITAKQRIEMAEKRLDAETPIEIEARAIALANLHKPWARRYVRQATRPML